MSDEALKTALQAGLESALQYDRTQEADRALTTPGIKALLDAKGRIDRDIDAGKKKYAGPRILLADFQEYDT